MTSKPKKKIQSEILCIYKKQSCRINHD